MKVQVNDKIRFRIDGDVKEATVTRFQNPYYKGEPEDIVTSIETWDGDSLVIQQRDVLEVLK